MALTFGTAATAPIRLRPSTGSAIPCAGCGRKVAERLDSGMIVVRRGGIIHARIRPGNEGETQCPHPPLEGERKACRAFTVLQAGVPLPPTHTASMTVAVVQQVAIVETVCTPLAEERRLRVA